MEIFESDENYDENGYHIVEYSYFGESTETLSLSNFGISGNWTMNGVDIGVEDGFKIHKTDTIVYAKKAS